MSSSASPENFYELWAEAFNRADLEKLAGLYEEDCALRLPGAGPVIEGKKGLREAFSQFMSLKGRMDFGPVTVIRAGDLALLHAHWSLRGTEPGRPAQMRGTTADVLRRQPDGSWKAVIDDPDGGNPASTLNPPL